MAHRALVAYERQDGTYSIHDSHHGAADFRLTQTLKKQTPFGEDSDTAWATETIKKIRANNAHADTRTVDDDRVAPEVEPVARATADSIDEVVNSIVNYLHYEAVYVVDFDWTVQTWVPVWPGLTYHSCCIVEAAVVGNGALIERPDSTAISTDIRVLTAKWATGKDIVGDGLDCGNLETNEAGSYLQSKLRDWNDDSGAIRFSDDWSVGFTERQ